MMGRGATMGILLDSCAHTFHAACGWPLQVKEATERAEAMNDEEELLGFPRSQFTQLEEAPKVLAPYLALWTTAQDFQKNSYMWLNGPMTALDPEQLEKEVGPPSHSTARPTLTLTHPSHPPICPAPILTPAQFTPSPAQPSPAHPHQPTLTSQPSPANPHQPTLTSPPSPANPHPSHT